MKFFKAVYDLFKPKIEVVPHAKEFTLEDIRKESEVIYEVKVDNISVKAYPKLLSCVHFNLTIEENQQEINLSYGCHFYSRQILFLNRSPGILSKSEEISLKLIACFFINKCLREHWIGINTYNIFNISFSFEGDTSNKNMTASFLGAGVEDRAKEALHEMSYSNIDKIESKKWKLKRSQLKRKKNE
jgi:hypothetical protein